MPSKTVFLGLKYCILKRHPKFIRKIKLSYLTFIPRSILAKIYNFLLFRFEREIIHRISFYFFIFSLEN